ncbi:MAG: lysophospholipid acyltransferase family protein [Pseudomonadota bacterium]
MTPSEQNSIRTKPGQRNAFDGVWGIRLRRFWTALSFTVFPIGALLFGLVYAPLLWLLIWNRERRQRIARASVSKLFGFFFRFMGVTLHDFHIFGDLVGNLERPALIVANHITLVDAVCLMWLFPGADCVVKGSHWRNPIMMAAVRAAGYLRNDDDEHLLTEAVRRLTDGGSMVLFPQGTRVRAEEQPELKRGAAVLALRSHVDLLPIRIEVSPLTLRKGEPWSSIPERRVHFHIHILDRIAPAEYLASSNPSRREEREASHAITERLRELLL